MELDRLPGRASVSEQGVGGARRQSDAPTSCRGANLRRLLGGIDRQRSGHGLQFPDAHGVALYWEYSRDPVALKALRRATDFHKYFTYPNGIPVETIDGRNRHVSVSTWGHFGFSTSGRPALCRVLGGFLPGGRTGTRVYLRCSRTRADRPERPLLPRRAFSADAPRPARFSHQMKVPAGIRKTGPWIVCLSGLTEPAVARNPFFLDRQGHVSVFHEKLGPIVTGANSKGQPELATFWRKTRARHTHSP